MKFNSRSPRWVVLAVVLLVVMFAVLVGLRPTRVVPSNVPPGPDTLGLTPPVDEVADAATEEAPTEGISQVASVEAPLPPGWQGESQSVPAAPSALPPSTLAPSMVAGQPSSELSAETLATRRMYLAHAPLRTPAVADPDAEENRIILQQMVLKALARGSQPDR